MSDRGRSARLDREIARALADPRPRVVCGECFGYAYQFVTEKGGTLKHGVVTHPWDKNDFRHAWVEKDGEIYDWQTAEVRRTAPVSVANFNAWWKPRDVTAYTADQARKRPWLRHGPVKETLR